MYGAPLNTARAADEGAARLAAAAAYFSNGTRSSAAAPSPMQSSRTQSYTERASAGSPCTASRIGRGPAAVMQR